MKSIYDPADHRAGAHRKLQLTRELKVERKASFHPSVGGSKGYNLWYRQQQMERHQNDRDLLVGLALVSLVVCIIVYPQAQLDEIAMYLYNYGVGLYFNQLISQRLKELQITNKKSSIKAFKAFSLENMRREFLFWNRQLPIGVVGIPWKHFIDVDEFAMEAKRLNWSNSWAIYFRWVNMTGELDLNQMEQQILDLAAAIGPFDATFAHCGYSRDGVYPSIEIPINPNTDPPGWGPLGPPGAG
eukprot:jgi/Psemu1/34048/gm1.34048_g